MRDTKTSPVIALLFFFLFILLSFLFHFSFSHCANLATETDKQALLAFKSKVADPFGALSTWNDSVNFCLWLGVTCSLKHQRVKLLNLSGQNLTGTLSPYIGNLTFLRLINLQQNSFSGMIPHEIGRLFRLRSIIFNRNMLQGEIPVNLTHCSELRILDLVVNKLEGKIPSELGSLFKLKGLGLANNYLTGPIPQSLSNLSFLQQLSLSENSLNGNIPVELGQLKHLNMFQVSVNSLTRSIPIQLFNITSMEYFAVSENQLFGELPPYIGFTLPNIRILLLAGNQFFGNIPHSISNASKLEWLDFANNSLTGSIPEDLGRLRNLTRLNFARNNLGTRKGNDLRFLDSLVNCTYLEVVSLSKNNLRGILPNSIANFSSHLSYLYMSANPISGSIPTGIGNLKNLILIAIEVCLLAGSIPISVGSLPKLQVLSLFGNNISGEIPSSFGNLTFLTELDLHRNSIRGSLPSALGTCHQLQKLDLSDNNLSGAIPSEVIGLSSLSGWLDLSHNHFTGRIPSEVGNLKNIRQLDLSENKLSGEIPSSLASCVGLEYLNLSDNFFRGPIHPGFSSLKGLEELDLSQNNFSGKMPKFLDTFPFLRRLNLSFNNLEGEVPHKGIFKNSSAISVAGNGKLCGGISELKLPPCTSSESKKSEKSKGLKFMIPLLSGLVGLVLVMSLLIINRLRKKRTVTGSESSSRKDLLLNVSYESLLKATGGFSSANLAGVGSFGSVYKGILDPDQTVVAVKVLFLHQRGALKSFMAECEVLRNIRHRNLVKIITACSSFDFEGNDFKALVYEFMHNGSLEIWLHPESTSDDLNYSSRILSLLQRLNIAIDMASALEYLHRHCGKPIVHCDLKPSNILLDNDMTAHVGDFGLTRFIPEAIRSNQSSSIGLKGTVGYAPPEYGMGSRVSTYGDVYSYGILLLETFTGKRPTSDIFAEGLDLHNFVKNALPEQISEVLDPLFVTGGEEGEGTAEEKLKQDQVQESLATILKIGVACSVESPRERMDISDVVNNLQKVKSTLLRCGIN
ncbi:LRR receptor-like serine/threonine-protein kinase EFR [Citrus sinensis]|uniref:LRR receptor-like serine/threonine-protein kinase EFR n=1 Tax=Citrus sinensis TaxID=2711 RepID=A0ACB8JUM9_CITSI|nr:LRR receptor-like serine/threonine-protein kinase EFR [Citrus sinensis]